jgi:hypothetical protein
MGLDDILDKRRVTIWFDEVIKGEERSGLHLLCLYPDERRDAFLLVRRTGSQCGREYERLGVGDMYWVEEQDRWFDEARRTELVLI